MNSTTGYPDEEEDNDDDDEIPVDGGTHAERDSANVGCNGCCQQFCDSVQNVIYMCNNLNTQLNKALLGCGDSRTVRIRCEKTLALTCSRCHVHL